MSGKTTISWAQKTWNPILGCKIAGAGCSNCYAMWRAGEIAHGSGPAAEAYSKVVTWVNGKPVWNGEIAIMSKDVLEAPLRWLKPAVVFVDSMADLFYEAIPVDEIEKILDVMHRADWHLFLVLTKRPGFMRRVVEEWMSKRGIEGPLRNIGLGSSVWDQKSLEVMIKDVSALPSRIRFLSAEPLIGPITLQGLPAVDWVIVGGESVSPKQRAMGERARPFDPAWARRILAECQDRGMLYHFKQVGENPIGMTPVHPRGESEEDIPEGLNVREMPNLEPRQKPLV